MSENTLKLDLAVMFLGSTANYQVRLLVGDRDGGSTVNADSNGFKLAGSWMSYQRFLYHPHWDLQQLAPALQPRLSQAAISIPWT